MGKKIWLEMPKLFLEIKSWLRNSKKTEIDLFLHQYFTKLYTTHRVLFKCHINNVFIEIVYFGFKSDEGDMSDFQLVFNLYGYKSNHEFD